MTTHPRTVSLLIARTGLAALLLGFALVGVWTANDLLGQAPAGKKQRVEEEEDTPKAPPQKKPARREEEEETKPSPKRRVILVDEGDDSKGKPPAARPAAPPSGDLKQMAEQASHPGIQLLFKDLAVPHDRVVFKKSERVTIGQSAVPGQDDVQPIAPYLGNEPTRYRKDLTLHPLKGKPYGRPLKSIDYVEPYERIAQERVRQFLKEGFDGLPERSKLHLSRSSMLAAANEALSAVLRWHESARQTGQREGDEWTSIENNLRKQLLDEILLKQLDLLAAAKDWDQVMALTRRLASSYTDAIDRNRIAAPVAKMIENALKDPTISVEKQQEARKRLLELQTEFPDNTALLPISDKLREDAASLLSHAKTLGKGNDNLPQVRELLHRAGETWPQLPGLREYKMEVEGQNPVLRVGVRGPLLPKHLSPAWACTDTERRIVEMLFESLVKRVPDEADIFRYRPALAEYRPKVVHLGRQFQLPRNALWSKRRPNDPDIFLDSSDIIFTLKLLKEGVGSGRSCIWGDLLDKVERMGDPFRMTLRLNQGYMDPLALMTFKILPAKQTLPVDSEKFAEQPVCSGPYFPDFSRRSDEDKRECLFFVANPSYGIRPGKRDLPRIQEIRFYVYQDPVKELTQGKLHLVLDLTAEEANKLREQADHSRIAVPLPSSATPNRRIYFLAINQRKVPDADVRKALAYAINREKLLDTHFRGPLKRQVHKALNGPFPVGSWACNPTLSNRQGKDSLDLYDAAAVQGLKENPAVRQAAAGGPLRLKYPKDDPALAEALKELCAQVMETTNIVLEPVPCDPCKLREDVEQTQSYDLAYYRYDFPDETYWLSPLLVQSGRANADNRNFLNFTDDDFQNLLRQATDHRDFAIVREYLQKLHVQMRAKMPLIPLWQLDPLLAHNQSVKPVGLDPLLVFTNIEKWSLQQR